MLHIFGYFAHDKLKNVKAFIYNLYRRSPYGVENQSITRFL